MNFILHDADLSGGDEISWNCVKSFGKSLKVADYVSCITFALACLEQVVFCMNNIVLCHVKLCSWLVLSLCSCIGIVNSDQLSGEMAPSVTQPLLCSLSSSVNPFICGRLWQ